MTARYAKHVSNKVTPQKSPIPGRESDMAKNAAGGYAFTISDWDKLDRFLILGAEGGTYYAGERELTLDNAKTVQGLLKVDGERVVQRTVDISFAGRAPKNDPALFVLALASCASDIAVRRAAFAALPKVARIGTHLFQFIEMRTAMRGWGRGLRNAVARWYGNMPVGKLALNLVKYQARNGWSNRDLLRSAHPDVSKTEDAVDREAMFKWAVGKGDFTKPIHPYIDGFELLKKNPTVDLAVQLIRESSLPREAIPTELLNEVKVWDALLVDMPVTATLRNLGKMTSIDLLKPLSNGAQTVTERLTNLDVLRKGRVHPLALLLAQAVYVQGRGVKGSLVWTPNQQIAQALNDAFYMAFKTVEPTGKRHMLALDISSSMCGGSIAGSGITPRAASAAMALVTANVEKQTYFVGFHNDLIPLSISATHRLDTVVDYLNRLGFGGTDCALPMLHAIKHGLEVDAFVVYTDNETWAGRIHPAQALAQYRKSSGINAKLVVVGMTATKFSIADPNDPGMLDVVGFDANTPAVIADFIRG